MVMSYVRARQSHAIWPTNTVSIIHHFLWWPCNRAISLFHASNWTTLWVQLPTSAVNAALPASAAGCAPCCCPVHLRYSTRRAHSSTLLKPHAAAASQWDRQTDRRTDGPTFRRTDTVPIRRPCFVCMAYGRIGPKTQVLARNDGLRFISIHVGPILLSE